MKVVRTGAEGWDHVDNLFFLFGGKLLLLKRIVMNGGTER